MTSSADIARRAFLARMGVLGAVASAGILAPAPDPARADLLLDRLVPLLRPVLADFAEDTMTGLSVFVVPGPDARSRAQGTPREEAGAVEAEAPGFVADALDRYAPFPDAPARPLAQALATGVDDLGITLPEELTSLLPGDLAPLDRALRHILENDETVPLSLAVAMLLNVLATGVDPASLTGRFGSPFSRLSFADKARVFRKLEEAPTDLVALLDARFPQPLRSSVSGLLRFLGGALLEFPAFASYSEHAVFDSGTRRLTGRPVGWELTGYKPDTHGPNDGWDDFIGYYQDRRKVSD